MLLAVFASLATVVCGVAVVAVTAAGAGASGPDGPGTPIIGNVVGRHSPVDRTVLGSDGTGCTATVQVGRGDHRFGAPVVHHYTIPGVTNFAWCPNMGVSVRRSNSGVSDLLVTWFIRPPGPAQAAYVLRHFTVLSGNAAQSLPSVAGTRDFDGDKRGDLGESTDQGDGLTTYLRRGHGFVPGPASIRYQGLGPSLAFGRLDGTAGTDIVAGYFSRDDQPGLPGSRGFGVVVVCGATGASVLLEHNANQNVPYDVAILDANHDGFLDVEVTGGPSAPRIYLGDGHGHFALAG